MPIKPELNVSGYRGIWGESLTEEIAFEYGLAFAKIIKNKGGKKILVGRDTRKTGINILKSLICAFKKEGLKIEHIGIIPTPSILLLVKKLKYDGGIMITASHNPPEYNGLKFIMNTGLFASSKEIDSIENAKENTDEDLSSLSQIKINENKTAKFQKIHIEEILKNINTNLIRKAKFKVALDPINGAGSVITQKLLKKLNCEVYVINGKENGKFTHGAEPLPKNLKQIAKAVKQSGSDIGFAQDPDADRLAVIDEKGKILSEEYTLVLAIKNIFSKKTSDVVVNMSTSRMNDDIVSALGKKVIRVKVGELNVVNKIIEIGAIIGGEGNGGVIYPKINMARDSLVGIALILELMAKEKKSISSIVNDIPRYILKKDKIIFRNNLNEIYEKLKLKWSKIHFNNLDGIRFDWKDYSWIHIRPSNTEPIIRIYSEAKDENRANYLIEEVKKVV